MKPWMIAAAAGILALIYWYTSKTSVDAQLTAAGYTPAQIAAIKAAAAGSGGISASQVAALQAQALGTAGLAGSTNAVTGLVSSTASLTAAIVKSLTSSTGGAVIPVNASAAALQPTMAQLLGGQSSALYSTEQSNLSQILTNSLGSTDTSGIIDTGTSLFDQSTVASIISPDYGDYSLGTDFFSSEYA